MSAAHQETEQANRLVKEALEQAQRAKNTSEVSLNESTALAKQLEEFLNSDYATPNDISTRASEVSGSPFYLAICLLLFFTA